VIAYDQDDAKTLKPFAEDIAKRLNIPIIQAGKRNPVCCLWLEILPWKPSPGEPGYLIINQGGGSLIQATNAEQMKRAVERFKTSIQNRPDGVVVPRGLMTSFPVVE
jgi:hypothetical protein